MSISVLGCVAIVTAVAIYLGEYLRKRTVRSRELIGSRRLHERGDAGEIAAQIVLESIAECFGMDVRQVRLCDDINRDFRVPRPLGNLTLDDPGEEIIETIKERIEKRFPPWDASLSGSRVSDIIESVAKHIADATGAGHTHGGLGEV